MKKIVGFLIVVLLIGCASKKEDITIDTAVQTNKLSEAYSFKIKEIISDSRCPIGVNCVWAGEVELVLSIYKEGVFYKEEPLIIGFKNFPENKLLLKSTFQIKRFKTLLCFLRKNKMLKLV